jgi:hypothetical protein
LGKAVAILWVAFAAALAAGTIAAVSLSSSIADVRRAIDDQGARIDEVSLAATRLSQTLRQVATLSSLRAQDEQPAGDTGRVRGHGKPGSLEQQVDELSDRILPYRELMDQELRARELREAARRRIEADRERYSEEELADMRRLYRSGRGRGDDAERRQNLEELIDKYPDSNLAGGAALRLAHGVPGPVAERWYLTAIDKYGDCYTHNGAQVGALARQGLADYYEENGQASQAKALRDELQQDYPDAVDHHGGPW